MRYEFTAKDQALIETWDTFKCVEMITNISTATMSGCNTPEECKFYSKVLASVAAQIKKLSGMTEDDVAIFSARWLKFDLEHAKICEQNDELLDALEDLVDNVKANSYAKKLGELGAIGRADGIIAKIKGRK